LNKFLVACVEGEFNHKEEKTQPEIDGALHW
jgi:hypothetical protein